MHKSIVIKYKPLCFILVWVLFIYSNSMQPAEQSSQLSGKVLIIMEHTLETISGKNITISHHFIRKAAHFLEYAILGFLLLTTFFLANSRVCCNAIKALCFSVLVAASDEGLQFFYEGRGPQVSDVCLDSCGAMFGIFIAMVFWYAWYRPYIAGDKKFFL